MIDTVQVNVEYPNGEVKSVECINEGGVWVGTVDGTSVAGHVESGYSVTADGVDERGNRVSGYMLGRGCVEILDASAIPTPI